MDSTIEHLKGILNPEPPEVTVHGTASRRSWRVKSVLPLLLFALAALNVVFWFPAGLPVGTGDGGLLAFYYHPTFLVHVFSSPWNPYNITGLPSGQNIAQLPEAVFFAFGRVIGMKYAVIQGAFYGLIQFAAMIFMYKFLVRLLPRGKALEVAAVFGAILYCYSPAVIVNYWALDDLNLTIIVFIPVVLYLGLETPQRTVVWGMWAWVLTLCACSQVFWNPAFAGPVAICLVASLSIGIRRALPAWPRTILKCAGAMVTGAIANLWFLLPLVLGAPDILSSASTQASPSVVLADANLNTNFWDLVRGVPIQANSPAWDYKLPPWRMWYEGLPFHVCALVLLLLMLAALIGRRTRRVSMVFGAVWLVGILFALGSKGPTGPLFGWAFAHVPYFVGFRNPGNVAVPLYLSGFIVMAACGVYIVASDVIRQWRGWGGRVGIGAGVVAIIAIEGWPLLTPNVLGGNVLIRGFPVSSSVSVPAAYEALGNYVNSHGSMQRTLVMPLAESSYITRRWRSGYDGINSSWQLMRSPVLSDLQSNSAPVSAAFAAIGSNVSGIIQYAGTLGCSYVLVDSTIRIVGPGPQQGPAYDTRDVVKSLTTLGARLVDAAGPLKLYRLPADMVKPILYVEGGGSVTSVSDVRWLNGAEVLAVLPPSKSSRLVVFNESPSSGWHLTVIPSGGVVKYLGSKSRPNPDLSLSSQSSAPTLVVDSSKNGWVVPPSDSAEHIAIVFDEEPWFRLSIALSAETIALVVVATIYVRRRHPWRQRLHPVYYRVPPRCHRRPHGGGPPGKPRHHRPHQPRHLRSR